MKQRHRKRLGAGKVTATLNALGGEAFVIILPAGKREEGRLDCKGVARISRIIQNGLGRVSFPNLDEDAWQFVKTKGA